MTVLSFGDNVRVRSTPQTESLQVAGLVGQVYGITTPSVTHVHVIGGDKSDQAVNVQLQGREESLWFTSDLLEFVDHAAGTEITIDGDSRKWVRVAGGEWNEVKTKKPWWKVW